MLQQVRFQNYRVLRDVTVDLGRFTVLVGPNGCGKTTVLDGVRDLIEALQFLAEQPFGQRLPLPTDSLQRRLDFDRVASQPSPSDSVLIEATSAERSAALRITPGDIREGWFVTLMDRSVTSTLRYADLDVEGTSQDGVTERSNEALDQFLTVAAQLGHGRPIRLALDPAVLAQPSPASHGRRAVAANGQGIATYLAGLAVRGRLAAVLSDLRIIVPQVRSVQPVETQILRDAIQTHTFDGKPVKAVHSESLPAWRLEFTMASGAVLDAADVSEGTLLAVGILAAMHGEGARLLLLDDLDRGLHPEAQAELIARIRVILAANPDLQVVTTSHSPFLVEHFEPEEVRVMGIRPDGTAACAKLTDHPDHERWRKALNAGEFWATVGESWVNANQGEGGNAEAAADVLPRG